MINRCMLIWACLFMALATTPAHADIAAENLPSIGNLAKLLGETDASEVESNVYDSEGKISAGIIASDAMRGETAANIAETLSAGNADQEKALTEAFNQARIEFENKITQANFDVSDLGVALATSFIMLWELSSDEILSETSALETGKFLVHGFSDAKVKEIPEEQKTMLRDFLMTTPVVFAALNKTFATQEGSEQQIAMLRSESEKLFTKLFKMPYDLWIVDKNGKFSIDIEQVKQYQEKNQLSSDW